MSRDRPQLADQREIDTVYGPAEDSRLLAETVIDRIDPGETVLDVGTGSGYVAARIAEECGASVVGTDLNPAACQEAAERGIPVVRGDLVAPFVADSFDVVVCNPPYLPTPPEQEWNDPMEAALSGGPEGLAMIRPLLETVGRVLHPDGRCYLLISTLTGREAVAELAATGGFETAVIASESHPFEELLVLELSRK